MVIDDGYDRDREQREEQERMRKVVARRLYAHAPKTIDALAGEESEAFKFCMAIAREIELATQR
jgi:hypothetical protein